MKVSYLTDQALDYLADQIYVGLCKVLGWENVFDFPWKPAYHDPACRAAYLPQTPGRNLTFEEFIGMLREHRIDLVVVSSPRRGAVEAYQQFAKHVTLPPTVLLDGEDDSRIRTVIYRSVGGKLYFKRELKPALNDSGSGFPWTFTSAREVQDLSHRIHPLQLSVTEVPDPSPRTVPPDIDISFVGRASHRKRLRAVDLLRHTPDIRFEGGLYAASSDRQSKLANSWFGVMKTKLRGDPLVPLSERGQQLPASEYQALLHRSKMALSIRGGGFDTLRYWEIVASKTLLISEPPDILIPNNFEHGVHAMFCRSDLRDLPALVRRLRDDDAARGRMVDAAFEHLTAFHTSERRAAYLLDTCRRFL